ncbi:MAG: ARMT1-like domain-containing protein [Candidatus Hydrothermarchaeales archaeon]
MKIGAECIPCLFERAKFECDLVFDENERDEKVETLAEIMRSISRKLELSIVPATIGTIRARIISKKSGTNDPYLKLKIGSDKVARELLPIAIEFYEESKDKVKALMKIAASANSMEYGVKGYEYDNESFKGVFLEILKEKLHYDERIETALERFDRILYLTDNAGEVVFDEFVARKMVEAGKEVVISPKSSPVINDATIEDISRSGLFTGFRIVPSGSYVGISLEEAPKEFLELLWDDSYLVFAKGMGYYETLSEFEGKLKGRLIYVLRAKCEPVARGMKVKRGELVAKMI